jgi:hypothetical protein
MQVNVELVVLLRLLLLFVVVVSESHATSFAHRFGSLWNQTFIEVGACATPAASLPGAATNWFGVCIEASPFAHEMVLTSHAKRCIAVNMLLARSSGEPVAFLDAHSSRFSMPLSHFDVATFDAVQDEIYGDVNAIDVERVAMAAAPRFPHRVLTLNTSTLHNVLRHWRVARDKGRFDVINFVFLNHIPRQALDVARGWFDAANTRRLQRFVLAHDTLHLTELRELLVKHDFTLVDDVDDVLVFENV